MNICIYKNLKISESVKLSKKKTFELHTKFMCYEFDKPEGFIPSASNSYGSQYRGITTLLSSKVLVTSKTKQFQIDREPNFKEKMQFIHMHENVITRYLVEKSYKIEITDEFELKLCDLFDVFGYNKPTEYNYFKS